MKLTCGIDEAGRGPIIGPMVMACVVLDDRSVKTLKDAGVRDSKKLSADRRTVLEKTVKDNAIEWSLAVIPPSEIDMKRKKVSLNSLEALKTAELITSLKNMPDTIFIDAADSIAEDYGMRIVSCINDSWPEFRIPTIVSEHKADDRYVEVGAASILAKVERDRIVEGLRMEYGDFGSGYPSDEKTASFVRDMVRNGEMHHFIRRSWNTLDKAKQSTLDDFSQS